MLDQAYRSKGINTFFNVPIDDQTEQSFMTGIMESANRLNYLINEKKMKVYVHCTSSCTRAPSVVIAYLCLYVRTYNYKKQWEHPTEVAEFVKRFHK